MKQIGAISVLLVEDNPGDARLVLEMLKESQFPRTSLHTVETLSDAILCVRNTPVDVVLLDLSLPDSHGLHSLSHMLLEAPEKPIVILTGMDDESVGVESVRKGAQDYLIKGQLDTRLLMRTIRYAIERKEMALEREKLIGELKDLLDQVKTLRGLLPMCAWCKKIRDDQGEWHILESFIREHSHVDVTHGICPECAAQVLGKEGG
jgi:DNA-binding response OmpR family regulator